MTASVVLSALISTSRAQDPIADVSDVSIRAVATVQDGAVRLAVDPITDHLLYLRSNGDVYRVDISDGTESLLYTSNDHGADSNVLGMAFGPDGTLYIVGNDAQDVSTVGFIVAGVRSGSGDERTWSTFAETAPYVRSKTNFDHLFNGIAVSPDGEYVFVSSGSRTDHGENEDQSGAIPPTREVPITSAIFRIPTSSPTNFLPNDEEALRSGGFLWADGLRNSFDLAFAPDGNLFATENSGDRDDPDELNWIREGHHYGFPWRMGTNDTPQQFPDYDPSSDLLLNSQAGAVASGKFNNDPLFPAPPDTITFTDPVSSVGPDGDRWRDATTDEILDASSTDSSLSTFTPHRSPLGLVFDTSAVLAAPYTADGFVLSWTGSDSPTLLEFGDSGEDLLHLELEKSSTGDSYHATVTKIVSGFKRPIDAVLVGNLLYVLEFAFGFDDPAMLWEIQFPASLTAVDQDEPDAIEGVISVFPNPSNGNATLEFTLNVATYATIDLFDALGRKRIELARGRQPAGENALSIDASSLPRGVYFVRFAIGDAIRMTTLHVVH